MSQMFDEADKEKLVRMLEFNRKKLARNIRQFSKDGERFLGKPITPEKYEEWIKYPYSIEMNEIILTKLLEDQEVASVEIEFIIELLNTSIKNNEIYLLLFNEDGTRFKGKKASETHIKQWERRKESIPKSKTLIDKINEYSYSTILIGENIRG